jgi:glycosyltransferase involved in cell wall biosynthesis
MKAVNICLLSSPTHEQTRSLFELAEWLVVAHRHASFEATASLQNPVANATNVFVGVHLATPDALASIPAGSVVWNTELLGNDDPLLDLLCALSERVVIWDASSKNRERLAARGVTAKACAPCFVEDLSRLHRLGVSRDIDVIIWGEPTAAITEIIAVLRQKGLRVECAAGEIGPTWEARLARARVFLDWLRPGERPSPARLSFLMQNAVPIVAAWGRQSIEGATVDGIHVVDESDAVEACVVLARNVTQQAAQASVARRSISSTIPTALLDGLWERQLPSPPPTPTEKQDLVSICIPAYKVRDLEVAIASALAQTYRNIEVIVSDDAPTDVVAELCAMYGGLVRYIENKDRVGRGQGNIRNLIREARGKYLKFLMDDDFLGPTCVQELMHLARHESAPRLMASLRWVTDEHGNPIETLNPLGITKNVIFDGKELIKIIGKNLINPIGEFSTVLVRRDDLLAASGEPWAFELDDVHYRGLGDVALWIRLAQRGPIALHAQPLSFFRQHAEANSSHRYNPEFIYAVTDWLLVLQHVARARLLDESQLVEATERLRALYAGYMSVYPELKLLLEDARTSLQSEFSIGSARD